MPFIKLTKLERRRSIVFIMCLICALGAWFFMALNNKYPYAVETDVIYSNEPQGKAFKALQPDKVVLQVEGTGWQLLFSRLRINPQSITVSLEKLNKNNYVLLSQQLTAINSQLETSQKVKSITPDTLYFDFSKRRNKRIPVKLVSKFSFKPQYGLNDDVELTPAYVNISGPQDELAKINEWYTDTLQLTDLQSTTSTRVKIKKNEDGNLNIYPATIGIKVPVDEFTEKTVSVPLGITNNTDYYNVKLYPRQVKVTFMVALSSYQTINEDFITAVVDMNEWKIYGHNQFTVKLNRFPNYCKLIKIVPNKINFIIEK